MPWIRPRRCQTAAQADQIGTLQYCVEVSTRPGFRDARAEDLEDQIELLGISGVESVRVADRYFVSGSLDEDAVARLATELLADPVVTTTRWLPVTQDRIDVLTGTWTIDVTLHPGVTDPAAESLLAGAAEAGLAGIEQAATGARYEISGSLEEGDVIRITRSLLANEVIQDYGINRPGRPPFLASGSAHATAAERVEIIGLDRPRLLEISNDRRLALDVEEMVAIQDHFIAIGREPTDLELETLAQTWSEHCVHKTFRARIAYTGPPPGETGPVETSEIDSILSTYIRAATEQVAKPWVRSAFVDDAGIIALDDEYDLAFKMETHNHPSALEPFGGANTGVGGVVRDVIGVSARPIANTNVLCFGPQDLAFDRLPEGVLHPRRIASGVVAGIEDYGNKMGIPTVNGAILFDPGYTANPLVFCGCLGVLPTGSHPTQPQVGDRVVVLGGKTGRDGLRGATFSSMETDHQTSEVAGSAVQIGHPIHEKQVLEALMLARDARLFTAITDCGAGGLSSSVGEMAAELGAVVHLERVPLKYPGLAPWEIWLSEAQERMVVAVPPDRIPEMAAICERGEVEMTVLGEFTGNGRIEIRHDGTSVGDLDCDFLHNGIPRLALEATWMPQEIGPSPIPHLDDPTATLLAALADPNIRSKEDVIRRYDHEVQGGTVVKPLVGPGGTGPADAAVVVPLDRHRSAGSSPVPGAALAVGVNPAYGPIDPYLMAWAAIDEAVRNVVAVGADPDRIAILDNFSWGNPRLPDRLGSLVRCTQGCHDAAVAYGTPFISGKDSLNNEYTGEDGRKHTIPGTLVISALGVVPDTTATVTSDLKHPGATLFAVGLTDTALGGSLLARITGMSGGAAPRPRPDAIAGYRMLHRAIRSGLVAACHDASEGGWAVAAAEMAIGGGLGIDIDLAALPHGRAVDDSATAAFSESAGRFLVEIHPDREAEFAAALDGYPTALVGAVRSDQKLVLAGIDGAAYIATDVAAATTAWRGHLGSVP